MSYVIEDNVHGSMSLPNYVKDIIATKEFQRLNHLKQLGVSNFVFKCATQTRLSHCIGTAYLCKKLLDILETNSRKTIDQLHKKCVIIAGLLHDIGHGPFSHLWEGVVHLGIDKTWTHEQQSVKMIEHLISSNNIKLDKSPETHSKALRLVTSMITADCETWKELLTPDEMFITEIVSNKFCNIDVDKFDYILRDGHHLEDVISIKPFQKCMDRATIVFDADGTSHIGYHANDFELIENLFYNRAYFHMNIYQHNQVAGAEKMVKDICMKSDAGGISINNLSISEVHLDSDAYLSLDDTVLDLIENSETKNESIIEAQKALKNLYEGRFYEMVWESIDEDPKIIFEALCEKFGAIFVEVGKVIPCAEVPSNIPLYNDLGESVRMTSGLRLSYKSSMIYCVEPDPEIITSIKAFIDSLNNNL